MSEKKSILARLLANENIEVRHGSYETAFFDVKQRLLGLPMWNDSEVYDLLIGHEVGHALYTPPEGWEEDIQDSKCPKTIFNVVEDIRIERLIQDKYPGLVASFNRGYVYLQDKDFFGLDSKEHIKIIDYNFIDRLNIKAKLRNLLEVDFTPEEQFYIDKAYTAETWDDVVEASELIYEFMKDKLAKIRTVSDDAEQELESDEIGIRFDSDKEEKHGQSEGQFASYDKQKSDNSTKQDGEFNNQETENLKSNEINDEEFNNQDTEDSTQDLSENAQSLESETDKVFSDKKRKDLLNRDRYGKLESVCQGFSEQQKKEILWNYDKLNKQRTMYEAKQKDTVKFMNDNKDIVANMVKEFELRKSAYMYSRASVSKTGSLDLQKLHQYKFNDDIFLSTTKLAESKNHGMVMLVDYSGSMQVVLKNVIKQTLILSMFCKKAAIPFVVYGFTGSKYDCDLSSYYTRAEMDFAEHSHIRVMELLSSSMKKEVYNQAFGVLVQQSLTTGDNYYGNWYRNSGAEALGDTPLNEALVVMYDVLRDFRRKHGVQKLSFVTLTDGGANHIVVNGYNNPKTMKLDGKYMKYSPYNFTDDVLEDMKSKKLFDSCMNYNLIEKRNQKRLIDECVYRSNSKVSRDNILKILRKENSYSFDSIWGYDRMIVITQDNSSLDVEDEELEIKDVNKKSEVIKAFKNFSSSKKTSRVLATKFAESIA